MAQSPAIPQKYHAQVINWISEGKTNQEMLHELSLIGVKASMGSVGRLVKKLRDQYQEVAQAQLAKGIEKTATQDLHIMQTVIDALFNKFKALSAKDELKASLDVASELNKWNARRIELSGINKDNHSPELEDDSTRQELLDQLNQVSSQKNESN